jgi:hypothetical protein
MEEEDDSDELDANVLDGVGLAGEGLERMAKRMVIN